MRCHYCGRDDADEGVGACSDVVVCSDCEVGGSDVPLLFLDNLTLQNSAMKRQIERIEFAVAKLSDSDPYFKNVFEQIIEDSKDNPIAKRRRR